jgi:cold shock CspA family protein
MAQVTIDVKITVDGEVFHFNNLDEYGYSIPSGYARDVFGRVEAVADTIHRALWVDDDTPCDSVSELINEGVK